MQKRELPTFATDENLPHWRRSHLDSVHCTLYNIVELFDTHTHTHTHTHTQTQTHTRARTHAHTRTHARTHTHSYPIKGAGEDQTWVS